MTRQDAVVTDMVASMRDHLSMLRAEVDGLRNERDAYANELALCEQDLRHALTRISELCEQLEALRRDWAPIDVVVSRDAARQLGIQP